MKNFIEVDGIDKMKRKCTLVIKDFSGNIIFQKECLCKKQALQELKEYWDNASSSYFHWDIIRDENDILKEK